MKNMIAVIIAAVLAAGVPQGAWAMVPDDVRQPHTEHSEVEKETAGPEKKKGGISQRIEKMARYRSQWKEINRLQQEHLTMKIELLKKREEAADLLVKAHQNGDAAKMAAAARFYKKMHDMHKDKKKRWKNMHEACQDARKAVHRGDDRKAKKALKQCAKTKKELNRMLGQKLKMWDDLLADLRK